MPDSKVVTVGWICAITTEYVAARAFLDEIYDGPDTLAPHDSNNYTLGRIGNHNVVIAALPNGQYGTTSAANVAKDLLRSFPRVRIGLMVGIGGGAPALEKNDIRLGDVVVSVPCDGKGGVFDYDYGKVIQGLQALYEEDGHGIDGKISEALKRKSNLRKKYRKPDEDSDALFNSTFVHSDPDQPCVKICDNDPSNLIQRLPRAQDDECPAIHYGLIASANKLMKDALIRDTLAHENGVLCFEMEAAGLMTQFPCLVIRGICDYSDSHKNKDWQGYAAMSAAAYAKDLLLLIKPNRVEAEKTLKDDMKELHSIVDDHRNISRQQLETLQEQRDIALGQYDSTHDALQAKELRRVNQCLQLFRLTKSNRNATYESYKGRVEDRVEGTCTWVLSHEKFLAWLEKDTGPLLISADPGCGKSVLAKYLVDHALPRTSTICYFFFKEQDQNTARQSLCALLHQLFRNNIALVKYAMHEFDKEGESLVNSDASLWSVFDNAIADPGAGSIIIVLDALDECLGPELGEILQHLGKQCREPRKDNGSLKCLFTSRSYEGILSTFKYLEKRSQRPSVERLAQEQNLGHEVKEELAAQLLKVLHRTYLWVYLVFDFLESEHPKKTKKGMIKAMETLPKSVNDAYEKVLSKSKDDKMVYKALAMILAAERPLTLPEMNVILNLDAETQSFEDVDLETTGDFAVRLRSWCGLFVSVYEGQVHLLHQTARAFLLAEVPTSAPKATSPTWQHSIGLRQAQAELAEICMRFLTLFAKSPGTRNYCNQSAQLSTEIEEFTQYASKYWAVHYVQVNFVNVEMKSLALDLCDPTSRSYSI